MNYTASQCLPARLPLHLLLAFGLLAAACGSEPEKKPPAPAKAAEPAPGAPGAPGAPAPGTENYTVLGENAKWKPVQELFEAYAKREIDGLTNFALNNITTFIEKPIIQEGSVDDPAIVAGEPRKSPDDLPDTCATKAPLDRYALVILMTGIAQPKAVLTDATGDRCEVIRGDALGNEGGRVTAITQYKLIVSMPGKEKPVALSIAPPISVLDEQNPDDSDVP